MYTYIHTYIYIREQAQSDRTRTTRRYPAGPEAASRSLRVEPWASPRLNRGPGAPSAPRGRKRGSRAGAEGTPGTDMRNTGPANSKKTGAGSRPPLPVLSPDCRATQEANFEVNFEVTLRPTFKFTLKLREAYFNALVKPTWRAFEVSKVGLS